MVLVVVPTTIGRKLWLSAAEGRRIEGIWTEQAGLDQAGDQSHRLLPNTRL